MDMVSVDSEVVVKNIAQLIAKDLTEKTASKDTEAKREWATL